MDLMGILRAVAERADVCGIEGVALRLRPQSVLLAPRQRSDLVAQRREGGAGALLQGGDRARLGRGAGIGVEAGDRHLVAQRGDQRVRIRRSAQKGVEHRQRFADQHLRRPAASRGIGAQLLADVGEALAKAVQLGDPGIHRGRRGERLLALHHVRRIDMRSGDRGDEIGDVA